MRSQRSMNRIQGIGEPEVGKGIFDFTKFELKFCCSKFRLQTTVVMKLRLLKKKFVLRQTENKPERHTERKLPSSGSLTKHL